MTDNPSRSWVLQHPGDSMNTGLWGGHIRDADDPDDYSLEDLKRSLQAAPGGVRSYRSGATVDLRPFCSPVRSQGRLNACVGFALASQIEFLQRRLGLPPTDCSPRFIWWLARAYELNSGLNMGSQIRNGLRALLYVGCSPEHLDPYDPLAFIPLPEPERLPAVEVLLNTAAAREPQLAAIAAASAYRIDAYYRLRSLDEFKQCLDLGYGFVMSCPIFASTADQAFRDGRMHMPSDGEPLVTSHALFVAGYQDDASAAGGGYLICKGSQGGRRGQDGYFQVPYAFATTPAWQLDAWTVARFAS